MTRAQKIIRARGGLLELARQLGNVSQARTMMGYGRDSLYRFRELYDKGGELAPRKLTRRKPNPRNRVALEIEQAVLAMAIDQPIRGQARVSNELRKPGRSISPFGARGAWQRRDLGNMKKRLRALQARIAREGLILAETQVVALEKARADKEAHGEFESECSGYRGARDTFPVGTPRGVGRVRRQTAIDTYAKVTRARLHEAKTPIAAADLPNDRVIPFFEENETRIRRMPTDRGTEYRGRPESHEYELHLAIAEIDHTRAKARSPHTNRIRERFHRTVLDGFHRVAFRKRLYGSIAQSQADLDGRSR
jgi:hypothetical protein